MEDKLIIIDQMDFDDFIADALNNGDTLTTPKESQMLIDMTGVSINSKPRKDGRYQGYILRNGEKKYLYGNTREEVATKIKIYLKEDSIPKRKKKNNQAPLFGEYVQNWIELYKKPNLKPYSMASLTTSLKPALEAFRDKRINSIDTDDIQQLLLNIKAERQRDICRTNLNQLFKKAVSQGILKKNPCEAVEIKKHKISKRNALTLEEQTLFLAEAEKTKLSVLYQLLISTGIRIGEALALHKSDVDFDACTITINKNAVFIGGKRIEQNSPKTDAGNRTIPVKKELCSLFDTTADLLFPFTYNAVRLATARISHKINAHVTLHMLRHTYATRLEEAGIPPKIKQYLMGHASLDMTENIYTDAQKNYIDSVSDKIRDLF